MDQAELEKLIQKYTSDTCSAEEKAIVEGLYNQIANNRGGSLEEDNFDEIREVVLSRLPKSRYRGRTWIPISIAASLLILLGFGTWLYLNSVGPNQDPSAARMAVADIPPGGNKAVLTLADGSSISLSDAANGDLMHLGNVLVSKVEDGRLVFNSTDAKHNTQALATRAEAVYNRMETPDGGQYQLVLPDGTHVWLNARSALRFPTDFNGLDQREVFLEGEAFFEVAHNQEQPFLVHTNDQTVRVLGTQFNINAYPNEGKTQTTLLEGAVQLWQGNNEADKVELEPGQQAVAVGTEVQVNRINGDEAIAWKNGFFQLDRIDIETFLRQVERWYGVEVEYKGAKPQGHYLGKVRRSENLSAVRELLLYFNIRTELKGKTLMVSQSI